MDKESTPDERSVMADEPTLDANRTVEDEDMAGATELPDKQDFILPVQAFNTPGKLNLPQKLLHPQLVNGM